MLKVLLIAVGGSSLLYRFWRYSLLAELLEVIIAIADLFGD